MLRVVMGQSHDTGPRIRRALDETLVFEFDQRFAEDSLTDTEFLGYPALYDRLARLQFPGEYSFAQQFNKPGLQTMSMICRSRLLNAD